jgi:hypothetical protein
MRERHHEGATNRHHEEGMGDGVNQRTDRLGLHRLGGFFAGVGWLFREQSTDDYGIDAQVEIADGHDALGALIGIQIKSGSSYFREQTDNTIVFRSNDRHI